MSKFYSIMRNTSIFNEPDDVEDSNNPHVDEWEDHIVYNMFCKDDLTDLPLAILIQLQRHINQHVAQKTDELYVEALTLMWKEIE